MQNLSSDENQVTTANDEATNDINAVLGGTGGTKSNEGWRKPCNATIDSTSVVQDTITDVKSFDMTWLLEIIKQGYLRETTERRDEVYHGVKGKLSFNFENQQILALARSIIDRARTRVPGFKRFCVCGP